MVLQGAPQRANLWGFGSAGSTVDISIDDTVVTNATVSGSGKWHAKLPATAAGGPHTIRIQSRQSSKTITDVMFGDVWVCSGQSNMEFEFKKASILGFQRCLLLLLR